MKAYVIILAAGAASRMQQCKALLPFVNRSALHVLSSSFISAGVTPIVVTGYFRNEVEAECVRLGLQSVHNEHADQGMFSSIQAGCKALPADASVFFVSPVDIPLIRSRTISTLLRHSEKYDTHILHPVIDDGMLQPLPEFLLKSEKKVGHPPCLHGAFKNKILSHSGTGGLAKLLKADAQSTKHVPVIDSAMLLDMDTPEDYSVLQNIAPLQHIPTMHECFALWNHVLLPEHIRRHSFKVADIASKLVEALETPPTVEFKQKVIAGALLHDIAKGSPDHAKKGADLIARQGFDSLSHIIASHSRLTVQDGNITESELVFLADKFVQGAHIVPFKRRYEEKMTHYTTSPSVQAIIKERQAQAESIHKKVETQTGRIISETTLTNWRI